MALLAAGMLAAPRSSWWVNSIGYRARTRRLDQVGQKETPYIGSIYRAYLYIGDFHLGETSEAPVGMGTDT